MILLVNQFLRVVANVDGALAIAGAFQNTTLSRDQLAIELEKEINWQSSACAFCNRLKNLYTPYKNVTIPLMNSIRQIQIYVDYHTKN